jgi:hypothetical protein
VVALVYTVTGDPAPAAPFVPPSLPGMLTTTQTTTATVAVPRTPPPPPPVAVAPPPAGQTDTQLATLAIELARRGLPAPIPLDAAGPAVHGVLYDRFLICALRVHARIAAGESPDPC